MIEPGIYRHLSSEEYHADKSSLSRSALMDFKKSPRKYWAKHLNPDRPKEEPKPSWEFGTAFHTLILEPDKFDNEYLMKPEPVLLKDVGREAYDAYKRIIEYCENSDKKVLSLIDFEKLQYMRDSLYLNERALKLIEGATYECSYFWEDEHTGLMLKSRPDIIQGNIYVDLKTIDDASPYNYQKEMAKYSYHIQAAMVKEAVFVHTGEILSACINICVEKTYPYSIGIYIIDETAIEQGKYEYKNILLDLKAAIHDNTFNDYEVQTIGLPKWAI